MEVVLAKREVYWSRRPAMGQAPALAEEALVKSEAPGKTEL